METKKVPVLVPLAIPGQTIDDIQERLATLRQKVGNKEVKLPIAGMKPGIVFHRPVTTTEKIIVRSLVKNQGTYQKLKKMARAAKHKDKYQEARKLLEQATEVKSEINHIRSKVQIVQQEQNIQWMVEKGLLRKKEAKILKS